MHPSPAISAASLAAPRRVVTRSIARGSPAPSALLQAPSTSRCQEVKTTPIAVKRGPFPFPWGSAVAAAVAAASSALAGPALAVVESLEKVGEGLDIQTAEALLNEEYSVGLSVLLGVPLFVGGLVGLGALVTTCVWTGGRA